MEIDDHSSRGFSMAIRSSCFNHAVAKAIQFGESGNPIKGQFRINDFRISLSEELQMNNLIDVDKALKLLGNHKTEIKQLDDSFLFECLWWG